jgi:hypothetical protein
MATTNIERENLEAHVELCAERYSSLDARMNAMSANIVKVEILITEVKNAVANVGSTQNQQIIKIGTAIVGGLLTAVIGLLVHLILK